MLSFRDMLSRLAGPAVALGICALGGEAAGQTSKSEQPSVEASNPTCPAKTACIGIQDFDVSSSFSQSQILSTALPGMLQAALVKYYPSIRFIPSEELWRAVHELYTEPDQWVPANLANPEVLRKVGANYILRGSLEARQGGVQLFGEIVSLSEEEEVPWQSGSLQTTFFAERQMFDAVSSLATMVVQRLAEEERLNYWPRLFVTTVFCDVSEPAGPTSLYASDLPKALAERGRSADAVTMNFIESGECASEANAEEVARSNGDADAVLTGSVKQMSGGSVSLNAQVFIRELKTWRTLPVGPDADASYLEQKAVLIDRFGQFLEAAVFEDGRWDSDILNTPRRVPALLDKAKQLVDLGDLDAAEFLLADALSIDVHSADAYHLLGLVQFQRSRVGAAVEQQRKAIEERSEFPEAYLALGDALVAQGDYEGAEEAYAKLPDSVEAHVALGNLASFQGDTKGAIAQFRQALGIEPENVAVRSRLADFYYDSAQESLGKSEYGAAYNYFDEAIRTDPTSKADRYFWRAYASAYVQNAEAESDYQLAIGDLRKALDIFASGQDPDFSRVGPAHMNLLELYVISGEYENAIKLGQEFLTLDALSPYRSSEELVIVPFHIVLSQILSSQPHQEALEQLRAQIDSSATAPSGWDFSLLEKYLDEKQPSLSAEQVQAIQDIKSRVQSHLSP